MAGMAAREEKAGTRARAGMRDERRDRAREDGAASWRATRRTDMGASWVTVFVTHFLTDKVSFGVCRVKHAKRRKHTTTLARTS